MAPQLAMNPSSPITTTNGSNDVPTDMLLTLYRSAYHRQGLLLESQEDLRRIVHHNRLVSNLKEQLMKVHCTAPTTKKRKSEEDAPKDVEQKTMPSEVKRTKIAVIPRVNRKRQSNDNMNFAVEKKKTKPNEKEVVLEEKKWKADPVESKETKADYEDPFGMDDLFAQLQIK